MNRRGLLLGLAAATLSWHLTVRAQRSTIETVGFLHAGSPDRSTDLVKAFQKGLSEAGYVRDENIAIEYRWANGQDERLPGLAKELTQRRVRVIAVGGNTAARLAVKAATATTPIVFVTSRDPLEEGLVASMNRPGANVTGVTVLSTALDSKRMELLHEMVPDADPITILANLNDQRTEAQLSELRKSAVTLGKRMQTISATDSMRLTWPLLGPLNCGRGRYWSWQT